MTLRRPVGDRSIALQAGMVVAWVTEQAESGQALGTLSEVELRGIHT